jgi:hypothetical protein
MLSSRGQNRRRLEAMTKRSFKYSTDNWNRCGLNIQKSWTGVNRCDVMVFGLCFYGRVPKWLGVERIFWTAGIWKSFLPIPL